MTRIATAAAFPHDRPEVAAHAVQSIEIDYLVYAYLNDTVLTELARDQWERRAGGHVHQFLEALTAISPALYLQPQLHVLTSAGGLDARGLVEGVALDLCDRGCSDLSLAIVQGDDLLDRLEEFTLAGCPLDNRETGERYRELTSVPVFARAWPGAGGVVEALADGARLIITGSMCPSTMCVAAAMHAHGWSGDGFDRLAAAASVGNSFRAGSACRQSLLRSPGNGRWTHRSGHLVAEIAASGDAVLSGLPGEPAQLEATALATDLQSTSSFPDVQVDATHAQFEPQSDGAWKIHKIRGAAPEMTYDVTLGLLDGYQAAGLLSVREDAAPPDPEGVEAFLNWRLAARGDSIRHIDCRQLAANLLFIQGQADQRAALEPFVRELAWLQNTTPAPPGMPPLAKIDVQPLVRAWPTSVPKELIETSVDCRPAHEWV